MISLEDNGRSVEVTDATSPPMATDELERWGRLVLDTLVGEQVGRGHLDLLFIDEQEMAALNEEHMAGRGPTDVLSFPMDQPESECSGPTPDDVPVHLGDVLICPAVARRQAPDHAGSIEAEFALLVVHGVLHVLGHDHADPDETAAMQTRERTHLRAMGFEHPS